MREAWRWFGPDDPVTLADIRQTGASEIVTALHHIGNGVVWPLDEIERRRDAIARAGLAWTVVESIPVSEAIKTRTGPWQEHIAAWQESLRNLARAGITTVCYNFMPVIDWTRTDLDHRLDDGALALRFDADAFAAFDLFILERPGAEQDWPAERVRAAERRLAAMSETDRDRLVRNIIAGLPGAEESYSLDRFRDAIAPYQGLDRETFRGRLIGFVEAVAPVAEEVGARLAIHPDDPPRPLLGLPRVMSTADDVQALFDAVPSPANGLTLCTGSFGVRADNDLPAMAQRFGERVHFLHLRSTRREADDPETFHEAAHLEGDIDMVAIIGALLEVEGQTGRRLPFRPDHGHRLLDDQRKETRPGYPAIGRLRGLAELRGVIHALETIRT